VCVGILALVMRQAKRNLYAPYYVGIHCLPGSTTFLHIISQTRFSEKKNILNINLFVSSTTFV